jgi:hypothetical protein
MKKKSLLFIDLYTPGNGINIDYYEDLDNTVYTCAVISYKLMKVN